MEIVINYIQMFLNEVWSLSMEMAPYLLLGMLVSGLISIFIDNDFIFNQIGPKNFTSIFKSTIFGIPLPLCSCGVIPVAATLREGGASKGSTVSFLVSTPQTGIDSIFLTYGMLGPVYAIFRPLAAFISGIFSGLVINNFDEDKHHHHTKDSNKVLNDKIPLIERVFSGVKYGFFTLPSDIVVPLFQGLVIAAGISVMIPPDFVANHFISNLSIQFLMMLAISIPIYVCATASIPIAVALMLKGISPGAAFVFLMAGPATNASSIAVIKNILGKKILYYYLALIAFTALFFGFILDTFIAINTPQAITHVHHHDSNPATFILTILFIMILLNAYLSKFKVSGAKSINKQIVMDNSEESIEIFVGGMTCNHCKDSVESAIQGFKGVNNISVDLTSGHVIVSGYKLNKLKIKKKIEGRGFTVN